MPLPINKTVTTTIMDDDANGGPGFARLSALPNNKPVTVAIPADLKSRVRHPVIAIQGSQAEGGHAHRELDVHPETSCGENHHARFN